MDQEIHQLTDDGIKVSLTYSTLDIASTVAGVKSPKAGAIALFAGNQIPISFPPMRLTRYRHYS